MKYEFEIKGEIISCIDCPILDGIAVGECRCWLNANINIEFVERPKNCPLKQIEDNE